MILSAVVVHYGEAPYLERCLASLVPPPGLELDVVLVESPSEVPLPGWVGERFPHVRVLPLEENAGFGAAANRGAAVARGELVLLLNNDAWLTRSCLPALAARLGREPRLAWAAPRLFYPDGRLQTVWAPDPGLWGEAVQRLRNRGEGRRWCHEELRRLLARYTGPGWYTAACALLRREAFAAVGGFDPGFFLYFEDADLCRRLRRAGWYLDLEPAARAFHASAGRGRQGWVEVEYRKSQLRYYRKHRPPWEGAVLRRYLLARYGRARPSPAVREILELLEGWGP